MSEENKKIDSLKEKLFYTQKHASEIISDDETKKADEFCDGYMDFLRTAKTEREATEYFVEKAEKLGFKPFVRGEKYKCGDKVYLNNRGKAVILCVMGKEPVENGIRLSAAHIDSPRLDLKPNPLYEDNELAYFKTHYYGGIKKYQWPTIPLAMHGKIIKADGTAETFAIGDEGDDITFTISDLLPHLADEQYKKTLSKAIEAESLNILVGGMPINDEEEKEPYKAAVLALLHDKFGICEEDFLSAEIEFVPASAVKDTGFDRSFIAGAGQDDRVCAYTSLKAILETKNPQKTAVCLLVDKEEIGSMGVTGMKSRFFEDIMAEIAERVCPPYSDIILRRCFAYSTCLSADVCAMHDPNYPNVMEKNNEARASHGVAIVKYTGSRGKSGASDASAELMAEIRKLFNENGVLWQSSELGKTDLGGGGTISQYVANLNIDTLDCGVPLLSMHSPYEISSKVDVYMAYKGYKAFFNR